THLISLGHMAFIVLGVVTASTFTQLNDWPPALALVASLVGGSILGFLVGIPALRIRGLYLILGTLALHFVALYLMLEFQLSHFLDVGSILIGRFEIFGLRLRDEQSWTLFLLPIVAAISFGLASLLRS